MTFRRTRRGNSAPVMRFSTGMFAPRRARLGVVRGLRPDHREARGGPEIADEPFEAEATLRTLPGLGVVG